MNNNEEGNSGKKNRNPLMFGVILALLPAVTYLIGISFYQGYQAAFGISNSELPASTQYVYLCAYHAIGDLLLKNSKNLIEFITELPKYYLSAVILIIIGVSYFLLWLKKKDISPCCSNHLPKIEKILSWLHWKNNKLTKSVGIVVIATYLIAIFFYISLSLAIFWWLFYLPSYLAGQERAATLIKSFTEEGCHAHSKTRWDTCHIVIDKKGNTIHEGLLLKINDKEIVMFKKDGTYTFPRQNDWLIQRTLH
ncbi:hypothetical protein VT99_10933 [Candidatus Electrothrix marina]|uniref:Uncharacterized protein n=1 Tax=Candidatus Electrothrix marina TaxID=1859130 RepID=A0A3S4TDY7_9BACT|nr:hypothetical protein VT99_10933 [Candidatus Electrothrix marina]